MNHDFELMDLQVKAFVAKLASGDPAPGGGSTAALSLCLGAALVQMVCSLTMGRKKYADFEDLMNDIRERAKLLANDAQILVQTDTDAYNGIVAAYALPKDSDTEKTVRKNAILEATLNAIKVPQTTAHHSLRLYEMALQVLEFGNSNAASDSLVAAHMAMAAGLGALANIKINLSGLKDEEEIAKYEHECQSIEETLHQYNEKALILGKVRIG